MKMVKALKFNWYHVIEEFNVLSSSETDYLQRSCAIGKKEPR